MREERERQSTGVCVRVCVIERCCLYTFKKDTRMHCYARRQQARRKIQREERSNVCENPRYQQVWVSVMHNRGVSLAIDCNVTGGCSPRNASSVYITLVAELGLAIIRVALPPRSASAGPRTTVPYRQQIEHRHQIHTFGFCLTQQGATHN